VKLVVFAWNCKWKGSNRFVGPFSQRPGIRTPFAGAPTPARHQKNLTQKSHPAWAS
jgi:hypothetical protein